MKIYLRLLIFLLNIIFALTTDFDNTEEENSAENEANDREWPEKVFSSSETSSTTTDSKTKKKSDPFWDNPITYYPPWVSVEVNFGESRYPFYDPSYPVWLPGYKPKRQRKEKLKNDALDNASKLRFDQRASSNEGGPPEKLLLKATIGEINNFENKMDETERKRYREEMKAGDMTRFMGINQHRYQPEHYRIYDLGRRFVPQYPYKEVARNNLPQEEEDPRLIPKKASPEFVLAIAKNSELSRAAEPINPNEELLKKESLRSGNYWNAYWKEEVEDPANVLRSFKANKLETVAAKLSPGTPIYEYVSKLNKLNPKLLYVINKQNVD